MSKSRLRLIGLIGLVAAGISFISFDAQAQTVTTPTAPASTLPPYSDLMCWGVLSNGMNIPMFVDSYYTGPGIRLQGQFATIRNTVFTVAIIPGFATGNNDNVAIYIDDYTNDIRYSYWYNGEAVEPDECNGAQYRLANVSKGVQPGLPGLALLICDKSTHWYPGQ